MDSSIFRASVFHKRLSPKRFFKYNIFWFHVYLDELSDLSEKVRWISRNRFNLYNFKDLDHISYPKGSYTQTTEESIKAYVEAQGITWNPSFRISILTNLRTLGYNFNPVSFIYIWLEGKCIYSIVEIANTFNEQKPYLLKAYDSDRNQFIERHQKLFYVSPFIAHDLYFEFNIGIPNTELKISINDADEAGKKIFFTGVDGKRQNISNWAVFKTLFQYPIIPFLVISQIHWQAFKLWVQKVPYFRKQDFTELQQDIYHPKK